MSKRILTDKEYIEGLADRCIWCKSEDINSGTAEFNEAEAYRLIRCSNCHKEWEEIFTITSTQEKEATQC